MSEVASVSGTFFFSKTSLYIILCMEFIIEQHWKVTTVIYSTVLGDRKSRERPRIPTLL